MKHFLCIIFLKFMFKFFNMCLSINKKKNNLFRINSDYKE